MPRRAFTLAEFMIVVAIVGVLSVIGITNFIEMQYRAKRAEVPSNVDGIRLAEQAYDSAFDQYRACAQAPSADPGEAALAWTTPADFRELGWSPDGEVRGSYQVVTTHDFEFTGASDVDGDDVNATFTASRTEDVTQVTSGTIY